MSARLTYVDPDEDEPDIDDDETEYGVEYDGDGCEGPDATERDRWADAACDRYERDMDARAAA